MEAYIDRLYRLRARAMSRGDATAFNDCEKLIQSYNRDNREGASA